MANTNVTKGEMMLRALTKNPSCELTPEGASYIKQRFDPYHDTPMKPVGYPDSYNGHTVSRCIKKSVTFTATSADGAAPTTPWSFHIFNTPIAHPTPMLAVVNQADTNLFNWTIAQNPSKEYGGLMVLRSDTGNFVYPSPSTSTNQLAQLSLSNEDLSNDMRVVAMGFELIDGTAELYRQGIITAYRQNEPQPQQFFVSGLSTESSGTTKTMMKGTGRVVKFPPTNTAQAMLIPDTKQWRVAEGAYCVADFNSEDIPMIPPVPIFALMSPYTGDIGIGGDDTIFSHINWDGSETNSYTIATTVETTITERNVPTQRYYNWNQTGIFGSDVNPLGSFTLNAIWYVECAPSGEDEELLSLCSQSPADDKFATMIVSKLRRDSPIAVKLRENYMGEWFVNGIRDAVKTVTPWLANAQTVGNQIVKWADYASTNDGYISPQSFVRGDVAKKVAKEKNPVSQKKRAIGPPRPPPPAPKGAAFRPTRVRKTNPAPKTKREKDNGKEIRRRVAIQAAKGRYQGTRQQ